jgi:hypothetical protein
LPLSFSRPVSSKISKNFPDAKNLTPQQTSLSDLQKLHLLKLVIYQKHLTLTLL